MNDEYEPPFPRTRITLSTRLEDACRLADVAVLATSQPSLIASLDSFKDEAVVFDVGYPRNLAICTNAERAIEVFDGGLVELPLPLEFSVDTGLPSQRLLFGCYAEALTLADNKDLVVSRGFTSDFTAETIDAVYNAGVRSGFSGSTSECHTKGRTSNAPSQLSTEQPPAKAGGNHNAHNVPPQIPELKGSVT